MKSQIEKIDLEQLLKGVKFYEEVLKKGFFKFDKLDLGKQVKWIKCKDRPDKCVHILDIREIDGKQFICLINRHFLSDRMDDWTDTLVQTEPYISDEDLKKFEIYNEL